MGAGSGLDDPPPWSIVKIKLIRVIKINRRNDATSDETMMQSRRIKWKSIKPLILQAIAASSLIFFL